MRELLLVIDMQNDFIDGALGTKEAVEIVPKVAEKIRNFSGTVLFTRDTHFENYMETQEGSNLPVPHCIKDSQGWQIRPELEELGKKVNAEVLDKVTFGSMELGPVLQKMNEEEPISAITLIGLCTDICVISNAMIAKAFLPEVPIIVDAACCAGVSPMTHDQALRAMEVCQIKVINKPVFITWLGHSCFRLEKEGYSLIIDPYGDNAVPGLNNVREIANAVYCSHEHFDHNGRSCVGIKEEEVESPFTVTTIDSWHDDVEGTKRGANRIHLFDDGNVRIAHMGDIGCQLTEDQIALLKGVDVALIPVGGFFTIGPKEASSLAKQIEAKHVIPMHYSDAENGMGYDVIAPVTKYLEEVNGYTEKKGATFVTDEVIPEQTIVLKPALAAK